MSTAESKFRPGNPALDHLLGYYEPTDAKTATLVKMIPNLSVELYSHAESAAKSLWVAQGGNPLSRWLRTMTGSFSNRQTLLARCIFDLMLSVYFQEVLEYSADKELSSLLVDSLLYQATSCEASSPTESQIFDSGTQHARGIHKFLLGRQHIGDIEGLLFGGEVAALQGKAGDFSIVVSVSPFSMLVRGQAKSIIRYFLYGTLPSEADRKAFEATIKEQSRKLLDTLNNDP